MDGTAIDYGQVKSEHGLVRRLLIPIYGLDQLLTLAVCGFALLFLSFLEGWSIGRAAPGAIGAYVGFIVTTWRSTPCRLLVPLAKEQAVATVLDNSRLIERTTDQNEWVNVRGRLWRWDTDTLRLMKTPNGLLVTGRRYDLNIIANRVAP